MTNIIYSFITIIIALFFIVFGTLTLLLPWSETIRTTVIAFIQENSWPWNLFGLAFVLIGLALAAYTLLTSRHKYFKTKVGLNETVVSDAVIQDYLQSYWEKLFPRKEIPSRFNLKKNKIQIYADLPYIAHEEQKDLLKKIELDLSECLRDTLGFRKTLELNISFETRPAVKSP